MKAITNIQGSDKYPNLKGRVVFTQTNKGVIVEARVHNLPKSNAFFGFHIHDGEECTGNSDDPFKNANAHYNPCDMPHPYHSGDLPPLMSNSKGYAYMNVSTDRFKLCEVIGKVVIIHSDEDDFTTQPGGNAGEKIACGKIQCQCR